MAAAVELPPQELKDNRRFWLRILGLLLAIVLVASTAIYGITTTVNNSNIASLQAKNNEATLCRSQIANDDAANVSRSQNLILQLIKQLFERNVQTDQIVTSIDAQIAKNTASADARQNSVDTCQAKVGK